MQLPPRQLRGLVKSGHFRFCGALQKQSDGRADEEDGSVCRCLQQPLRRQQRHADGTPEAGGGPPPYPRAYHAKRHEVICILNFVFVLYLSILVSLVLVCVAAVIPVCLFFYTAFLFFSR